MDFESMKEKRESLFFKEALNLPFVYTKETVRLYLEDMAEEGDAIILKLPNNKERRDPRVMLRPNPPAGGGSASARG